MRHRNRTLDGRRRRIHHELVAWREPHGGRLRSGTLLRDGFGRGYRARSRMMAAYCRVGLAGRVPLRRRVELRVRRLAGLRNMARGARIGGTRRVRMTSCRVRRGPRVAAARFGRLPAMRLLRSRRALPGMRSGRLPLSPCPNRRGKYHRRDHQYACPHPSLPNAVPMSGEDYTESNLAIIHTWTNIY